MRARNIKPGFFLNCELSEVDFATRLLFIGLWCYADREGRFEWKPKQIKAAVFPYDNVNIDKLLNNLVSLHVITRYEGVGYVPHFKKHQHPHPHEPKSILPEIPNNINVIACNDNGIACQEDLGCYDVMIEDIRKEDTSKKPIDEKRFVQTSFDWFWKCYASTDGRGRQGNKSKTLERLTKSIKNRDDALCFCFAINEYLRQVDTENERRAPDNFRALKLPEVIVNEWQGYIPNDIDMRIAKYKESHPDAK